MLLETVAGAVSSGREGGGSWGEEEGSSGGFSVLHPQEPTGLGAQTRTACSIWTSSRVVTDEGRVC